MTQDLCKKLSQNQEDPRAITIADLAAWVGEKGGCRLSLPPIQRSVVWTNQQILNFWDSLLRGYPPGLMLVHRAQSQRYIGRDEDGATMDVEPDSFQLFDGQQRLAAILLGLGRGQLRRTRKIWVDLAASPASGSGLKFQLRMSSSGQPFGYDSSAPNTKITIKKRSDKWKEWDKNRPEDEASQKAFEQVTGGDIIDSECAVPLAEILRYAQEMPRDKQLITVMSAWPNAKEHIVRELLTRLDDMLRSRVIIQVISGEIVGNPEEYIQLFTRCGQGGTRLTDDELTYSIIKYQHPKIHDAVSATMKGPVGRLATEVDFVLAALRVAKVLAPWEEAKNHELVSRPTPQFVSTLDGEDKKATLRKFGELVGLETGKAPELVSALETMRDALSYDTHPSGLPGIIFGGLPTELVDVLALLAMKIKSDGTGFGGSGLTAFILHWLVFVDNNGKAAWLAYEKFGLNGEAVATDRLGKLMHRFEEDEIAYVASMPSKAVLATLQQEVEGLGAKLRGWGERFQGAGEKLGESLRVLSSDRRRIGRMLMWLQRSYITKSKHLATYDPTSERDDDLPIDLDHLVPQAAFDFNWRKCGEKVAGDVLNDEAIRRAFYENRHLIGNSIGNFRWLDARHNRSRQDGEYERIVGDEKGELDLVEDGGTWRRLSEKRLWTREDVAMFQKVIDMRTLWLYKKFMTEAGIWDVMDCAH
ncbi:MAG: DUF262 domain-containing protein [Acidiferrobacter thiooxydans]